MQSRKLSLPVIAAALATILFAPQAQAGDPAAGPRNPLRGAFWDVYFLSDIHRSGPQARRRAFRGRDVPEDW